MRWGAQAAERDRMEEQSQEPVKKNSSQRREETDRAFSAIMEDQRRSRLEKNARLREMRLGTDRRQLLT